MTTTSPALPRPRVFMSYSWTSDEHADWVRDLADRLVNDGVDVILDQYDLKEGQDKFAFMEQMVTAPDVTHVLALSDARYAERADGRAGGVGTETLILTPKVYADAGQERVIPVILGTNEDGTPTLPTFLAGRWAMNMTPTREADGYEQLLRVLFGKPRHAKPQLGTPPTYITEPAPARLAATRLRAFTDALHRDRNIVHALAHDLLDAVAAELDTFQIAVIPDPNVGDDLVVQQISNAQPLRDDIVAFLAAVALHRRDDRLIQIAGDLFELLLAPQRRASGRGTYRWQFDQYQFLGYDLFLHGTALCLQYHRLDLLGVLTDRAYLPPRDFHRDSNGKSQTYTVFETHCKSLDDLRNRRVFESRRLSVTADLVNEHATHSRVKFADFVGADLVLFLKAVVVTDGASRWYPHLVGYAEESPALLRRATHKANFKDIAALMHVSSGDELRERFAAGAARLNVDRWFQSDFWPHDPVALLLLQELDTRE